MPDEKLQMIEFLRGLGAKTHSADLFFLDQISSDFYLMFDLSEPSDSLDYGTADVYLKGVGAPPIRDTGFRIVVDADEEAIATLLTTLHCHRMDPGTLRILKCYGMREEGEAGQ